MPLARHLQHVLRFANGSAAANQAAAHALFSNFRSLRTTQWIPATNAVRSFSTIFGKDNVDMPVDQLLSLNSLRDNPGATKRRKRVGRGPGSGLGKTCGRGHKGVGQRRSLSKRGFEGGQTPLWKRTPKRGFLVNPKYKRELQPLSLQKLLVWIRNGRLDPSQTLTMKVLSDSGIFGNANIKHGVKLLGAGHKTFQEDYPKLGLPVPKLEVTDSGAKPKAILEEMGGSVKLVWFARVPLRAHFKPHKFDILPKSNGIPPRKFRNKYDFEFPKDRIYTGEDKIKTFAPRY